MKLRESPVAESCGSVKALLETLPVGYAGEQQLGRAWLSVVGSHRASDPEAGVARGIDFHHVCAVLNFDLPPTPEAYIHRAGR